MPACLAGHYIYKGYSCRVCDAGKYSDSPNLNERLLCSPGRYASRAGQSSCDVALQGSFSPADGSQSASLCAPGQFTSATGATSCSICPAGSFSGSKGSVQCQKCPKDSFLSIIGGSTCTACPAGGQTPFSGALSASECLSPLSNFIFGSVALFLALIVGGIYVIFGRFRFASYIRRERVVMAQVVEYRDLMTQLSQFEEDIAQELWISKLKAMVSNIYGGEVTTKCWMLLKDIFVFVIFVVLSVSSVAIASLVAFALIITRVFFQALIIWKQNNNFLRAVPFLVAISLVVETLMTLLSDWHFPAILVELLRMLLSTLTYVFEALALFKIDVSGLNVTCSGAKAPFALLENLIVLGSVIIVIESQMQMFRGLVFRATMDKYNTIFLSREYCKFMADKDVYTAGLVWYVGYGFRLLQMLVVQLLSQLFDFNTLLQFMLAQVQISVFVANKQTHTMEYTDTCNKVPGAENFDALLAYGTTALAFAVMLPAFYEIAKVVCPNAAENVQNNEEEQRQRDKEDGHHQQIKSDVQVISPVATKKFDKWSYLRMPLTYLAPDLLLAHFTNGIVFLLRSSLTVAKANGEEDESGSNHRLGSVRSSLSIYKKRTSSARRSGKNSLLVVSNPMMMKGNPNNSSALPKLSTGTHADVTSRDTSSSYADRFEAKSGELCFAP